MPKTYKYLNLFPKFLNLQNKAKTRLLYIGID